MLLASICHSSNLFRFFFHHCHCHHHRPLATAQICFEMFFFTTHWHPRGQCHAVPCRVPLKLGRQLSELIHESVPSGSDSDSAFQPASHFKKVQNCCRLCLSRLRTQAPFNLSRLARLASWICSSHSGSGRGRRTERKEMMD